MSCKKYLLLVKDYVSHTESIFNNTPIIQEQLKRSIDDCCKSLIQTHPNVSVQINAYDTYAEVICTSKVEAKGWIWNSTVDTKQVVYLVQAISLIDSTPHTHVTLNNVACQTDFTDTIVMPLIETLDTGDHCEQYNLINLNKTSFGTGYANTLLFPTWRD
jgi:hypothetical protein